MSVANGTWNITIQSPMGARENTVDLMVSGDTLTGTASGPDGSQAIAEGKVVDAEVSWSVSITKPVSTTLQFSGVVDGDSISGTVKAGMFGGFPFSGRRA